METEQHTERKEVIQLNGLTILVGLALMANFLIVGFVYRWHQWELFSLEKADQARYTELLDEERNVKEEIVRLEGVSVWNETAYARSRGGAKDE